MTKVKSLVDCTDAEAVECLNDFVESIQMEMSVGGSIPFTLPAEPIAQIVKNSKSYFYKSYEDAHEEMFISIPQSEIEKKKFNIGVPQMVGEGDREVLKSDRGSYLLPDGVISVVGVYEINGWSGEAGWNSGLLGKNAGDISINRMLYQSVYDRTMAISADNTMYYICTESFLDLSRQIFQNTISFKYNRLTNKLRFIGKLPVSDVVLDVLVNLARILSTFTYQMPGNISINVDSIANDGATEKEAIRQELRDLSGAWYIMTT